MTQTFVPFAALAAGPGGKLAPASPVDFKPVAASTTPSAPRPDIASQHQPVVKLQCDGDVIKHIQIQCSCGQLIDLDCVY
jgi:hypothetical protein